MTKEKCLEILAIYRAKFQARDIPVGKVPHGQTGILNHESLVHAHGMLDEMEQFIREDRMEKFFRWLGFVQGVLWRAGIYSLEELRNHNRLSCETPEDQISRSLKDDQ